MHRGKTVGQLIDESVGDYLKRTTYNNTTEIASLLEKVGIEPSAPSIDSKTIADTFEDLGAMMSRRHRIVH